jgi:hypothetical protein
VARLTLARNRYAAAHDRFALAFDRGSVRRKSPDGHLHVASSIVSSACVNDYLAEEIPNFRLLGLQPGRMYALLRDPFALEKAVPSLHGKPLVIRHREQTAGDHDRDVVVGSVSNPTWQYPNVTAEITVWDGEAIDLIESGKQADLSCGYFYQPLMERGSFNGVPFSGRMINIVFNHCALVDAGRVVGASVGDSAIKKGAIKMGQQLKESISALQKFHNENLPQDQWETADQLLTGILNCPAEDDDEEEDDVTGDDPPPFKGRPEVAGKMTGDRRAPVTAAAQRSFSRLFPTAKAVQRA